MRVVRVLLSQAHTPSPRIFSNVADLRQWRAETFQAGQSVGLVPTMGALHDGHLSLVQRSLDENEHTIVSIFVNPAQFAPNEDYATYPRTMDTDLLQLSQLSSSKKSKPVILSPFAQATTTTTTSSSSSSSSYSSSSLTDNVSEKRIPHVFTPSIETIYPSGIQHNVEEQIGAFVEVKGFSHQMEGKTRPTFFRGVATICTKLFNLVQPSRAYFGQKDIQQGVVLRQLLKDLHFTNPYTHNCVLVPTSRDPNTGLALSSRNVHIEGEEKEFATTLFNALRAGQDVFENGNTSVKDIITASKEYVDIRVKEASNRGILLKLDYISVNDVDKLAEIENIGQQGAIMSGALWIGKKKTRIIDNLLLGGATKLFGY